MACHLFATPLKEDLLRVRRRIDVEMLGPANSLLTLALYSDHTEESVFLLILICLGLVWSQTIDFPDYSLPNEYPPYDGRGNNIGNLDWGAAGKEE